MCLFPRLVTSLKIALLLILLSFPVGSAKAQDDVPLLDGTQTIKQNISGGEYRFYRIMLRADQYVRFVVQQRGVDVRVKFYQPDGELVAQSNRLIGAYGPEIISWVARTAGFYKLEVRALPDQLTGQFELKLQEEHIATLQDQSRIRAQTVFLQAEQLREQRTPASLDQSLTKYNEPLQVWKEVEDSAGEAETLNVIGLIYEILKRDRVNARQQYEKALQIWQSLGDHRGEAESLYNIARVNESLGERQIAIDYYNRSLQPWRDINDQYGEAWTLFNMGRVYSFLKDVPKAQDHLSRALKLWRELSDSSREAATLNSIGEVYFLQTDYKNALASYDQARERWQAAKDLNGEVSSLFAVSRIYGVLHDEPKETEFKNLAEQLKEKVQQARVQSADDRAKSDKTRSAEQAREEARKLLFQNAEAQRRQAIAKNEEAAGLYNSVGEYDREIYTLFDVSSIYRLLSDKENERKTLERSLSLAQRVNRTSLRAEAFQRLGDFYTAFNDPLRAVDNYDRAIQLWRERNDRSSEAYLLGVAAKAYENIQDKDKAIAYLERALKLYQDLGDRFREAYTFNDLAAFYHKPEETQKTLDYLKRTRELRREKGDRAGEAETLKQIVAIYLSLGDKREALGYYHQALALYRQVQDGLGEAQILRDLMVYWKDLNHPRLAIFYGKQAINTYQKVRQNLLGLEKQTQTSFLKSKEDVYRELADLLISAGRLPEAQQVLDMLKEEEYINFLREGGKTESRANEEATLTIREGELYKRYVDLTDKAAKISALHDKLRQEEGQNSNSPQLKALRAQLDEANGEFQGYLNQLSEALLNSDQIKDRVRTIQGYEGLMTTLNKLGPGTAGVYTPFVKNKYSVVLFKSNLKIARQRTIPKDELYDKIMALRVALQDEHSDSLQLSKDLYKLMIGPIADVLADAKPSTLMWSLDGILRYVPVAVLHDGEKYMLERYPSEVFTLASISRLQNDRPAKWRGLGLGVSRFSSDPPLPEVTRELKSIIRNEDDPSDKDGTLPGKRVLDHELTKTVMTDMIESRQYNMVHIATHFKLQPKASYLVLGKGETFTVDELGGKTGLFDGVDLLTLSACNTATNSGDDSGQEIDNFGEVAQRQGALAVVASLWSVNDASTGLLMKKFYQVLTQDAKPLNKAESLREAQLAFLRKEITAPAGDKDYTHPHFWAPFILVGNWK